MPENIMVQITEHWSLRLSSCWFPLMVAVLCFLLSGSCAGSSLKQLPAVTAPSADQVMSSDETDAVYEVLEAINKDTPWRQVYAEGNLCLEGPHGLVCGADEDNMLHVVELNLGWVSDATNNPLCGTNASFSPALTRFPYLRKLFFYNCFSQSREVMLPPFLWTLGSSLEELVLLHNTKLVGGLPEDIAKLVNLKRLILVENNALQGMIPENLGELMGLEQLVLSRNGLTGGVPTSLGSLSKLRVLDLSWNLLEGKIPISLVNAMGGLQKLDLSHNKLSGSVPPMVGEASSLELLDLSWNNLMGPLPDGWARLRHLRVLQMGHNSFQGSALPRAMWTNLSRLIGVGMAEAGLRGRIPESMGKLKSLRYLDLRGNVLEGEIPASIGGLVSIFEMDLSSNRLRGMLPFTAEFVEKMGRNLRVDDNEGLCSSPNLINVSSPPYTAAHVDSSPAPQLMLPVCVGGAASEPNTDQLYPAQRAAVMYMPSGSSTVSPFLPSFFFWSLVLNLQLAVLV